MTPVLVTGGAGFFGGLLKKSLMSRGIPVVSLDLEPETEPHPLLTALQGDIRDEALMASLFEAHRFETVYHCAAILAHVAKDRAKLWSSNVDGTRITAETARRFGAKSLVFTSSNCLWGQNLHRPVREDDTPAPVEIYGRSKWEGEKILRGFEKDMNVAIIRCPTIMDEGRLGLLTILFDFIREGRKVWVVGGGENRYQFIYAKDLIEACSLAAQSGKSNLFHVGSDDVKTFREVYGHVIRQSGTGARVAALPKAPTLFAMRAAYANWSEPCGYASIGTPASIASWALLLPQWLTKRPARCSRSSCGTYSETRKFAGAGPGFTDRPVASTERRGRSPNASKHAR